MNEQSNGLLNDVESKTVNLLEDTAENGGIGRDGCLRKLAIENLEERQLLAVDLGDLGGGAITGSDALPPVQSDIPVSDAVQTVGLPTVSTMSNAEMTTENGGVDDSPQAVPPVTASGYLSSDDLSAIADLSGLSNGATSLNDFSGARDSAFPRDVAAGTSSNFPTAGFSSDGSANQNTARTAEFRDNSNALNIGGERTFENQSNLNNMSTRADSANAFSNKNLSTRVGEALISPDLLLDALVNPVDSEAADRIFRSLR